MLQQNVSARASYGEGNGRDSEIDAVLAEIAEFRHSIIAAWQDRAVLLTPEDQRKLKDEIVAMASLLRDLTLSA